ncbi:MAG: molybdate ABC transporter substrate-binding protein [bacterium]|nr:molybdate ABC transporter substrate-binding protein [bacterium]
MNPLTHSLLRTMSGLRKRLLLLRMPLLAIFAMIISSSTPADAGSVRVSAAASLTETVGDLATAYRAVNPGDDIVPNFGASGALAKQVEAGAPVDILLSASTEWLDYLKKQYLVARSIPLTKNSLVFVGSPKTVAAGMKDLPALSRIALGSPASVPAGKYASEAMKAAGIETAMKGKAVFTKDVREALMYAERGEVDGAFVFKTDALVAKSARFLFDVPASLHSEIIYPAILTPDGAKNPAAVRFFDFLSSGTAKAILKMRGFTP